MDERERQREIESRFADQLRQRARGLLGRVLPADDVRVDPTSEGLDEQRDTLRRLEIYDRSLADKLPGAQADQLTFTRRSFGGLINRTVSRVRARMLADLEPLVRSGAQQPIGREQVLAALARYQVMPAAQQPTGVIFASATGFSEEARRLVESTRTPTLVLVTARSDGGWDVAMPAALRGTPWEKLLEFESGDEKTQRLMRHLESRSALLDSRGVPLPELARDMGLSVAQTETLIRQACRLDSRLMTVAQDGVTHLCRAPLADDEGQSMSIWSQIRRWLRLPPTTAERVRAMTAQRVRLEQVRHEVDRSIEQLETQEREALKSGAAAASDAERKQVAGKLMRLRRDLGRMRSQANIYTQQLDILGTHIHHLTLNEKGRRIEIPNAADLTREAAAAERVMGELSAAADLARGIEVTGESPQMMEQEAAIMEELRRMGTAEPSAQPQAATPERGRAPAANAAPAPVATERTSSQREKA